MAILEKEVWVGVKGKAGKHYEDLGYEIPKYIDKRGRIKIKIGTKILVRVEDVSKGSDVKLTKICDECGCHITHQTHSNIIIQRKNNVDGKDRCETCGSIRGGLTQKENIPYKKSLEYFAKKNNKEYLLNEFSDKNKKRPSEISYGTNEKYFWDCHKCKSEYDMKVSDRTSGSNCPYCKGLRVNHSNCIWTTNPEMAKLLLHPEDGYKYTSGSNKRVSWKCPDCNTKINNKIIRNIIIDGLSCPKCSDGISYPEKFMFNVLDQLNIEFEYQKTFNWSDGKKYDFYIPLSSCIIETHGLQHYEESNRGRNLKEEQENDNLKEKLTKENGIKYYVPIDCRYSELEFIKNNILESELSIMFDLSETDWKKCHEYACGSLVKEVCEMWDNGVKSPLSISKMLKIDRCTVRKYLKQGSVIGLCKYNPKEEMIKNVLRNSEKNKETRSVKIIQLTKDNEIIKEWSSITDAQNDLHIYNISAACSGIQKTAGGYRWTYKEDYEKSNGKLPQFERSKHGKPVVQLALNNDFIREWNSITEAGNALLVNISHIPSVCKGKRKITGGFKWMYKEDYKEYIKQAN